MQEEARYNLAFIYYSNPRVVGNKNIHLTISRRNCSFKTSHANHSLICWCSRLSILSLDILVKYKIVQSSHWFAGRMFPWTGGFGPSSFMLPKRCQGLLMSSCLFNAQINQSSFKIVVYLMPAPTSTLYKNNDTMLPSAGDIYPWHQC